MQYFSAICGVTAATGSPCPAMSVVPEIAIPAALTGDVTVLVQILAAPVPVGDAAKLLNVESGPGLLFSVFIDTLNAIGAAVPRL